MTSALLAAVGALIGLLSFHYHIKVLRRRHTLMTRLLHLGLAVVWFDVFIAYIWIASHGGSDPVVSQAMLRPAVILLGSMHIALAGQRSRGEW